MRLAAPHQLHPKPEADDLVFGKHFTDHMLKIAYHRRLGGWQVPEIMPMENLVLHPAAKVFHYAVEVSFISFQPNDCPTSICSQNTAHLSAVAELNDANSDTTDVTEHCVVISKWRHKHNCFTLLVPLPAADDAHVS